MDAAADQTAPMRSRWDQADAEYVSTDAAWIGRCAVRMVEWDRFLDLQQAVGLSLSLSTTSLLRARSPECVADDMMRTGGETI
ncbi:MAG TPA: hypothetical protein VF606_04565 [Geminicoccaceae bacterium]|jgi:hypothetical protein